MKGYCDKCGILIDETEIVHHICEFWIDGHFVMFWSGNSYYCFDRDLYLPKRAMVRLTEDRIYIDPNFAKAMVLKRKTKVLRNTNKFDMHLICFVKALNKAWVKEPYVEPEPQFRVSLP